MLSKHIRAIGDFILSITSVLTWIITFIVWFCTSWKDSNEYYKDTSDEKEQMIILLLEIYITGFHFCLLILLLLYNVHEFHDIIPYYFELPNTGPLKSRAILHGFINGIIFISGIVFFASREAIEESLPKYLVTLSLPLCFVVIYVPMTISTIMATIGVIIGIISIIIYKMMYYIFQLCWWTVDKPIESLRKISRRRNSSWSSVESDIEQYGEQYGEHKKPNHNKRKSRNNEGDIEI